MDLCTENKLRAWADRFNDPVYFEEDPIIFPKSFLAACKRGEACRQDVEVAAIFAAHLAWGRRSMIVRDLRRLFEAMGNKPYDYVMKGGWRDEPVSVHRTIKWSDIAAICARLRTLYESCPSIEKMSIEQIRCGIYGSSPDRNAANKKINMMRRWMVRQDGKVDLGLWKESDPAELLIPLDVHVHRSAVELGLTTRNGADNKTVEEITSVFREIFPGDPCLGDFALFGHGVTGGEDA